MRPAISSTTATLAKMKPGSSLLLNTARGRDRRRGALTRALDEGRWPGPGLDVYENEPAVTPALLDERPRGADASRRERDGRDTPGNGAYGGRRRSPGPRSGREPRAPGAAGVEAGTIESRA